MGRAGSIVSFQGGWRFLRRAPAGLLDRLARPATGFRWLRLAPSAGAHNYLFGIQSTPYAINRLAVSSHSALFTHASSDLRLTINKAATVKRYHYDSHDELRTHLGNFVGAYNFARRLKTLKGLTPYEFICKCWTSEPKRFKLIPHHQMPGLNSSIIAGCWSQSAISRRQKPRHATTLCSTSRSWPRDSNETASGKPGAVHQGLDIRNKPRFTRLRRTIHVRYHWLVESNR